MAHRSFIRSNMSFLEKFARRATIWTGSSAAFALAVLVILVWGITGPVFHFSDTWQLVINTGTTIVTFLMVFLIQNAQNRESKALHLKLDELILSARRARNELIDIELLTDDRCDFDILLRNEWRHKIVLRDGAIDVGSPITQTLRLEGQIYSDIERLRRSLTQGGVEAKIAGLSANYSSLVDEVRRVKATPAVDTPSVTVTVPRCNPRCVNACLVTAVLDRAPSSNLHE